MWSFCLLFSQDPPPFTAMDFSVKPKDLVHVRLSWPRCLWRRRSFTPSVALRALRTVELQRYQQLRRHRGSFQPADGALAPCCSFFIPPQLCCLSLCVCVSSFFQPCVLTPLKPLTSKLISGTRRLNIRHWAHVDSKAFFFSSSETQYLADLFVYWLTELPVNQILCLVESLYIYQRVDDLWGTFHSFRKTKEHLARVACSIK